MRTQMHTYIHTHIDPKMNQAPAAFDDPMITPRDFAFPPSWTCHCCAWNPQTQALRTDRRGRNCTPIWHHLTTPTHLDYVKKGRDQEAMAAGYPLYVQNPPQVEERYQCLVCSLDEHGVPRVRYTNILAQNVMDHLTSVPHHERVADGRAALYAAANP